MATTTQPNNPIYSMFKLLVADSMPLKHTFCIPCQSVKKRTFMHKEKTYTAHAYYTLCVDMQHIFTSVIRQRWFISVGLTTESFAFILIAIYFTNRQIRAL